VCGWEAFEFGLVGLSLGRNENDILEFFRSRVLLVGLSFGKLGTVLALITVRCGRGTEGVVGAWQLS